MTQTVPDISPLMPMHQDPLLVRSVDTPYNCIRRGCGAVKRRAFRVSNVLTAMNVVTFPCSVLYTFAYNTFDVVFCALVFIHTRKHYIYMYAFYYAKMPKDIRERYIREIPHVYSVASVTWDWTGNL